MEDLGIDGRIMFWRNVDQLQIWCWMAETRDTEVWREDIVEVMPQKMCRYFIEEEEDIVVFLCDMTLC